MKNLDIYQLNTDMPEGSRLLFTNFAAFEKQQIPVHHSLYNKVYTGPMLPDETLEDIYARFNIKHPAGFRGHSLSVSDVVVVHSQDTSRAYFVDSIGFQPVPDFLKERTVEQKRMPDDVWAVGVGYNFTFVPQRELEGIALKPAGHVRFQGENWNLFKAKTYEESRIIDSMLDKYGEYSIREHRIEPVMMHGELELVIPGVDRDRDALSFGGYRFMVDGKEIPVDFSGTAWSMQQEGDKLRISFETGRTNLATDLFLDDCYESEYNAAGLRLQDITAAFLSKSHAISDFHVLAEVNGTELDPADIAKQGSFAIKSLAFSNGTTDFPVRTDVLEAFNQDMLQEQSKANTAIDYLYRDADNYKVGNNCVVSGTLTQVQQEEILSCLDMGLYFIPSKVGLPEQQFDTWSDQADHPWFELSSDGFSHTDAAPTVSITASELVQAFKTCKDRWIHQPAWAPAQRRDIANLISDAQARREEPRTLSKDHTLKEPEGR